MLHSFQSVQFSGIVFHQKAAGMKLFQVFMQSMYQISTLSNNVQAGISCLMESNDTTVSFIYVVKFHGKIAIYQSFSSEGHRFEISPILHLSINIVRHKVTFMFLSLQMRLHVQYVRVRWFPLIVVMKLLLELLYHYFLTPKQFTVLYA